MLLSSISMLQLVLYSTPNFLRRSFSPIPIIHQTNHLFTSLLIPRTKVFDLISFFFFIFIPNFYEIAEETVCLLFFLLVKNKANIYTSIIVIVDVITVTIIMVIKGWTKCNQCSTRGIHFSVFGVHIFAHSPMNVKSLVQIPKNNYK